MTNKYNLFLDDVRIPENVTWAKLPHCSWVIVRNYKEFRNTIWNMGIPEFIAYDHDLSDAHYGHGLRGDQIPYDSYTEKTGYDCARFLVNECNKLAVKHPPYIVHSMNPIGKQNIISYVESYNKAI